MSFNENQARDKSGRWAGGAEAQTRNAARNPVAPHDDQQSVGTHVAVPVGAQVGKGIRDLIGASANNAGDFTKDTRTGKAPTSGYQVAGSGGRFTGQWTDPATGKVFRERSHNVDSLALAKSMGRRANQIAIYDIARRKEIATGGTGKVRP